MLIYKILRHNEWAVLASEGRTAGAPVDIADGFVHFSTADQLPETLSRHFASEPELILLACDADALAPDLKWEKSRNDALFPHLYRALSMDDVRWHRPIQLGPNGHQTGELE